MGAKNQHYNIAPEQGWDRWFHNPDLSVLIFDFGFNKVNSDTWHYINPMAGMGIFGDQIGQYICLETQDISERNHIISMHCGLITHEATEFRSFIEKLKDDYDLVASLMNDSEKMGQCNG